MQEVMRQGLYDPNNEHDACGVGFVVNIKGRKSHDIISQGLKILENLDHRGAVGADPLVGDGAGILIQLPDALLNDWARAHGKPGVILDLATVAVPIGLVGARAYSVLSNLHLYVDRAGLNPLERDGGNPLDHAAPIFCNQR